jgi:hypothetical protein
MLEIGVPNGNLQMPPVFPARRSFTSTSQISTKNKSGGFGSICTLKLSFNNTSLDKKIPYFWPGLALIFVSPSRYASPTALIRILRHSPSGRTGFQSRKAAMDPATVTIGAPLAIATTSDRLYTVTTGDPLRAAKTGGHLARN